MHLRLMLPRLGLLFAFVPALAGCGVFGSDETLSPEEQLQKNLEDYESLQVALEKNRTDALGKGATEATGIGNRLFWLEFPTFNASLHSLDTVSGAKVHYSFGVGDSNSWNYRATDTMVVTTSDSSQGIDYLIHDAAQPGTLLGQFSTETPGSGIRWYAYAPDANAVYFVRESQSSHDLLRFTLGSAQPEHVLYLEETGMSVGEFQDFGIEGNTAIMVESGRIWSVDIGAKKATWLENETESYGAQWDAKGVFYSTAKGPFFYSYETQENRDIKAEIEASGYLLNDTFNSIHFYSEGGARNGDVVAYIGRDGLFLYNLATKKVKPALLNHRDNSIVYRSPTLLENGKLFVLGLESSSGATGAEGGWYEVTY